MSRSTASGVTDEQLLRTLRVFTRLASTFLINPGRWASRPGADEEAAGRARRLVNVAKSKSLGEIAPGAVGWEDVPLSQRVDWWVDRISNLAAIPAAAGSMGGFVTSRLNTQDLAGAAGAGLAICATAKEFGLKSQEDWVSVVAQVLFHRDLRSAIERRESVQLSNPGAEVTARKGITKGEAIKLLHQMSKALKDINDLLDDRPKGGLVARGVAKVPAVGLAGGYLAERKAMRRAADETARLLS